MSNRIDPYATLWCFDATGEPPVAFHGSTEMLVQTLLAPDVCSLADRPVGSSFITVLCRKSTYLTSNFFLVVVVKYTQD